MQTWNNFPDPETYNLLIWRRKEIESYFIDPDLFSRSEYLKPNTQESNIWDFVQKEAQKILFQAAANATIVEIRENLKERWIELFRSAFESSSDAKAALTEALEKTTISKKAEDARSPEWLNSRYEAHLKKLTGGGEKVIQGQGQWLHLLPAKKILNKLVSEFTIVKDDDGKRLQGPRRLNRVIAKLLENPDQRPDDFQKLTELLRKRVDT